MNTRTSLLLVSVFTLTSATAAPLTNAEIFSAIDGEFDHTQSEQSFSANSERTNFDLSPQSEKAYKNTVTRNRTQFNFSLDVRDTVDPNESFEEAPAIWENSQR